MATVDAPIYWEPGPAPAPKRGLFSVAEVHNNVDPHLALGAEYLTNRCTAGCEWEDLCEPPGGTLKDFMTLGLVSGVSFVVYDALECYPTGVSADEQESRLRGTFDVKAEAVCEARLQALLQGSAPLAAANIIEMIAVLEEQLAKNYAGLGTLHMDRYTGLVARDEQLIEKSVQPDGQPETINGTPVALGRGYSRTAGKYWAGAAGRVIILRGPLTVVRTPPLQTLPPRVLIEQQCLLLVECVAAWSEADTTVVP